VVTLQTNLWLDLTEKFGAASPEARWAARLTQEGLDCLKAGKSPTVFIGKAKSFVKEQVKANPKPNAVLRSQHMAVALRVRCALCIANPSPPSQTSCHSP
jgi:hypothetical protein